MYTCHFRVYATEILARIGYLRKGFDGSQDHDLILRTLEKWAAKHPPKQLIDWPFGYQLEYCWLLLNEYIFKFRVEASFFNGNLLNINEPPWPRKTQECNSKRAFISHSIPFQ